MASLNINPMQNIYKEFLKILDKITIKYTYKAAVYDTLEIKQAADEYIDAVQETDNFYSYTEYTDKELIAVGITSYNIISEATSGNIEVIPYRYRDNLLLNKRTKIIENFEEQNNYYRTYMGYPPHGTPEDEMIYLNDIDVKTVGIPYEDKIPIHLIQKHFNEEKAGLGDYYISVIEGTNIITRMIEENPDKEYLKYIGSNSIDLIQMRKAKNFSIIQLNGRDFSTTIYETFLETYEQCRSYFTKVIYNSQFRSIIPYYDNFIGLCIMVMTFNTMIMKQIPLGIKRQFYDKAAVVALYEAYNVPYNINIDDEKQSNLIQNLNLLIQHKATDKVIYDIAKLLGFSDVNVYKYYLMKERKFDEYGVPVVKWTERFNNDTGEYETCLDQEAMYDTYFQRSELLNQNFLESFVNPDNTTDYYDITSGDPYWWEDNSLYKRRTETDFNFVESKYLALSIAYSMTDMVFDNTILLKLLMSQKDTINDILIGLPKITGDLVKVPLFDVIVTLVCLLSAKHSLTGEIITYPTQVMSVVDYIENIEGSEFLADTLSFDFSYFKPGNKEGQQALDELEKMIPAEDFATFKSYLTILAVDDNLSTEEKIDTLNKMFSNVKAIYHFLQYNMSVTKDPKLYLLLKRMYRSAFYAKEMIDIFTITGPYTGYQRPAKTYFEYLYYINPKLYNCIFTFDLKEEYQKYLTENGLTEYSMDFETFEAKVELGEITLYYDTMKDIVVDDTTIKDEKIYYYMNHIVNAIMKVIDDVNYSSLMAGSESPVETLLLKLVRFFKSYTVDIFDIQHRYVCDLKTENLIKFIDAMNYMRKIDQVDDYFKLNHSDVINSLTVILYPEEFLKLKDRMNWVGNIYIDDTDFYNSIRMKEELTHMTKIDEIHERNNMMDTLSYTTNMQLEDKSLHLKDKVTMFYSD